MPELRGFHFPDELHYLVDQDMWARPLEGGRVRIGITDLGARLAGEFFAFMPKPVGTRVELGGSFGLVEMAKALRAVRSAASGVVVAVNADAVARPARINAAPYGEGWLIEVAAEDWTKDEALLTRGDGPGYVIAMTAYMDLYNIR
jgi:glycine cleavage system H lipoate-binding protein